jgi:TolB-like protein
MLRIAFAVLAGFVLLTAAPVRAADPILVVFPFAQNEGIGAGLGAAVVDKIATELTAAGGVTVVRGSLTAKPAQYRALARAAGADFYLSGSIAAVGVSYSAIEQLVTTGAGIAMFSTTFAFHTVDDVHGEGEKIRDAVVAGTKHLTVPQQPPQPSP